MLDHAASYLACSTLACDNVERILQGVLDEDLAIPGLIGTFVVAIVLIRTIAGVAATVTRERTRREIAAYIAEGSMTPEQGERLMSAGRRTL